METHTGPGFRLNQLISHNIQAPGASEVALHRVRDHRHL